MYKRSAILDIVKESNSEDWGSLGHSLGHGELYEDGEYYGYVYEDDVRLQIGIREEAKYEADSGRYDYFDDEHYPIKSELVSIYFNRNLVERKGVLSINSPVHASMIKQPSSFGKDQPEITRDELMWSNVFNRICFADKLSEKTVESELEILVVD